jgi:hypothetical protein
MMFKRVIPFLVVALISSAFTVLIQPLAQTTTFAQGSCRAFSETGKQVCGRFLEYWQQNGGLAQQGLPLSNEFTEVSDLNGQSYTVQYFERAVFEKHPENARPYDVLLSQLGTFQFKRKYPNGDPSGGGQPPAPQPQPAPSGIIGQVIEYSGYLSSGKLRGTVTDVKEAASVPASALYPEIKAKGKFVIVFMDVTNIGNESAEMAVGIKLRDNQGRTFDRADTSAQRNAAEASGLPVPYEDLQPGLSEKTVVAFDVATDAVGYLLVPSR